MIYTFFIKLFIKIINKLHLGRFIYIIVKPFIHEIVGNDENDIIVAKEFLQDLYKNPQNSCICIPKRNNIVYDLQIIIPTYNTAQFIERCIDSVLSLQTSYNIIITVVDDGSKDNTCSVLKKYEFDSRVEVIKQENRGYSGARNRALDNIKARYITFLDSDDEFLNNVEIDKLLSFIENNDIDILECGYITFNDIKNIQIVRHKDIISNNVNKLLYGFPWGKIYNAKLFSHIHFPEEYWFEDTVMSFIIFPMCKTVATSSTLLYHYRINPNGITFKSRGKIKSLDTYWITEQLLVDRATLGLHNDKEFAEVMLQQIKMNYNRIRYLDNKNIDRAVFILTADLWNKHFRDLNLNSELAKALIHHNFLQYRLILELN